MRPQSTHNFAATLQFGTVSAVDAAKHALRVTLPALENLQTDWLPMITPAALGNRFYSLPDVGTLVVCLLDAQGESGAVLGAIYNDADTPPAGNQDLHVLQYSNGTRIEHDRSSGDISLETPGRVSVRSGGTVTVEAPLLRVKADCVMEKTLTVNGLFTYTAGMAGSGGTLGHAGIVSGSLKVTGNVNALGDVTAGDVSLQNHIHEGDSGGKTGRPE